MLSAQSNKLRQPQLNVDARSAERVAELFRALSDPNRVRIIAALLNGELNVSEIAGAIGMSNSSVSHQLRMLRQIHLVRTTRSGREIYYALDDDHVVDIFSRGLDHIKHG
ncbi:MAG: metalloregulator ArsR/SmtB family transcription factor [Chloroflexi bacterium]|nr:metalloregulator ArsR/SmtB family transcription factor [Chloroflexota bacterium]MCL5274458.1 metalloregulator ArsR/SmtB family transcription factor [Chloroflexota bacterium]